MHDKNGDTALHYAVNNVRASTVKFLIEHKADPNYTKSGCPSRLLVVLAKKEDYWSGKKSFTTAFEILEYVCCIYFLLSSHIRFEFIY
jgi:ankyrin repeat protein